MPSKADVEAFIEALPGKRGKDIPEDLYDRMYPVAAGITKRIWGREPTPHQMHDLFTRGIHTPEAIHAEFGALPHPHAPSVSVDEYEQYSQASELYRRLQR